MDGRNIPNTIMGKTQVLEIPIEETNNYLERLSAEQRISWAIENFSHEFALTTSFGIQSSVLLHMMHRVDKEKIAKIIWIDTGYLPPETYKYAEQLSNQLKLDITIAQSEISPARMEALYGKLWTTNSIKDLEKYNMIRKVEPLEASFNDLRIKCWASGVRKSQTDHRKSMNFIAPFNGRLAVRPILDWTKKDIFYYMERHKLPQHPLFEKGYSTVGDWHSSSPESIDKIGRDTRFGGLKQECGLHLPTNNDGGQNH